MTQPTDQDVFAQQGGTRAIAAMLDEKPSTVQSWKTAGRIPPEKQRLWIRKSEQAGHPVTAEQMVWPFGRGDPPCLPAEPAPTGPSQVPVPT